MSRWRRLSNWVVGLGFLCALGGVVFHFVRHRPRCVITGPLAVKHLSSDGSRLVTVNQPDFRDFRICGPVQVWDLRGGKLLCEALGETDFWIVAVSPNGGHVAILLQDRTLRLFDCDSGEVYRFTFEAPGGGGMTFSRSSRWLCVGGSHFIDLDQHRIVPVPKRYFVCFNSHEHAVLSDGEFRRGISVVDLRTGDTVASAVLGSSSYQISPDGSLVVAWRGEGRPLPDRIRTEKNHGLEICDLTNLKQRFHWMVPESFVDPSSQAVFSGDGRTLAYWHADETEIVVRFFDLTEGRPLSAAKIAAKKAGVHEIRDVPPSGAVWTCVYEEGEQAHLVLMEAATGRVIDKRQQDAFFTRVANDTVLWHDPGEDSPCLQLLDARTGFCRAKTRIGRSGMVEHVSPDGRHIVATVINDGLRDREAFFWEELLNERWPELFRRHLDMVFVIEAATGRERFSTPAYPMWDKRLADDGGTFVSVDWSSDSNDVAIRVWDVEPTRAWLWAIGVPTALAAAWALLARFRRIRPINQPTTGQIENLPHGFS